MRKNAEREQNMVRKAFSKYLDQRLIPSILKDREGLRMGKKHINFAMILVREDSQPEQAVNEIVTLAQKHGGMVDSITGTFITVYFGVPLDQPNQKELRIAFLNELSEKLGPSLAIVHGECKCPVGTVGNDQRMTYTAFLPDLKEKLGRLCSLEFGRAIEC